jgi:hypothetical protein
MEIFLIKKTNCFVLPALPALLLVRCNACNVITPVTGLKGSAIYYDMRLPVLPALLALKVTKGLILLGLGKILSTTPPAL